MFFSKQCSLVPNNSSLPTADFNYIAEKRLSSVTISAKDIGRNNQNLDSNKAQGHDKNYLHAKNLCTVRGDF